MGKNSSGSGGFSEANDTLCSLQKVKVLDAICEGEIEGLVSTYYKSDGVTVDGVVDPMRSIYFNDVPFHNSLGTSNFRNTTIYTNSGTQAQPPLTSFNTGVEAEVSVGTDIRYGAINAITKVINSNSVNKVRVTLSTPRLTYQDGNNLVGSAVQYKISLQSNGGSIIPLTLGSMEVPATIVGNVATTNANSSRITGTCNITNTSSTSRNLIVDVKYRLVGSGTWILSQQQTITIHGRSGNNSDSPDGKSSFKFTIDSLTPGTYECTVVISTGAVAGLYTVIALVSSTVSTTTITLSGKTTSKYTWSYEINLPDNQAPHNITVERLTIDAPSQATQNQLIWDSYTEIISSILSYPNTALIGIITDAKQFNSIPTRSYRVKLKKIRVPSNYNPITRIYTGIWDGTFSVPVYSNNPAWCFYDLVTNSRYGLGEYISESTVDKFTLYTIGKYCDEIVPNGFGGTEPRFTCNLYLQNQDEAFRVLQNMASIFRAMLIWQGGVVTPIADKPESVWAQFTNADVVEGLFSYQGSASKTRHTVALVTWNDMSDRCRQKIEYVADPDAISRYGVNQTDVVALGCTSRAQAHRLGKWILYTEKMETDIVSFKSGLKGISILPGKIINIVDQYRSGVRNAGRVLSSTTTSITIDSPINIDINVVYSVSLEMSDGTLVTRTLDNLVGLGQSILTWATPLATQPLNSTIWMVTESTLYPETFRILSIVEETDNMYNITAVEHNTTKFNYIDLDAQLVIHPTSIFSNVTSVGAITNPAVSDSIYKLNNETIATKIHISWNPIEGI